MSFIPTMIAQWLNFTIFYFELVDFKVGFRQWFYANIYQTLKCRYLKFTCIILELNPEQRKMFDLAVNGHNVYIGGPGGTGKIL